MRAKTFQPSENVTRDSTFSVRTTKQIKALAEIVATENNKTLSSFVEDLIVAAFFHAVVQREEVDIEPTPGPDQVGKAVQLIYTGGRPLVEAIDDLYDDDDATCFVKRLRLHLRGMTSYITDAQSRLLSLIDLSRTLHPDYGYDEAAIREHWEAIIQIAKDVPPASDALRKKLFGNADIEYALMSEAEKIKLLKRDPKEFSERSHAYHQRARGTVSK